MNGGARLRRALISQPQESVRARRSLAPPGSWEASFRFCARIGTMNRPRPPFGHPLPLGGGRDEGADSWKAPCSFRTCSRPMNRFRSLHSFSTSCGCGNGYRQQKQFRRRVGEPQPRAREPETIGLKASPPRFDKPVHLDRPFLPQIEAGGSLKLVERPARVHAQTKRGGFARSSQGRQLLAPLNRAAALFELFAVKNCV